MFRRARYGSLIDTQLDLFVRDHQDVLADVDARLRAYNEAGRDEAEELYGDYVDAVESATEALADMRDRFRRTLDDDTGERYEEEFNRAVKKRWPALGLEIDLR